MRVFYKVDGAGEFHHEVNDSWCISRPREQQMLAELCAEHFEHYHDGWEATWPSEFELLDPDTKEAIAKFNIEKEYEPTFSASPAKEP